MNKNTGQNWGMFWLATYTWTWK